MTQNDAVILGSTQVVVGLSQVIRFLPGDHCRPHQLKVTAGGSSGTLTFVGPQLSGSSSGSSFSTSGYAIGSSEVFAFPQGPVAFYLAATGVTMTASLTLGYTAGATLL